MAAQEYYNPPAQRRGSTAYSRNDPPRLPPLPTTNFSRMRHDSHAASPVSPVYDTTPLHGPPKLEHDNASDFVNEGRAPPYRISHQYSDEIPLRDNFPTGAGYKPDASDSQIPLRPTESPEQAAGDRRQRRRRREQEKKGWLSGRVPWAVYFLSVVQIAVFIGELAKNGMLTLTLIVQEESN